MRGFEAAAAPGAEFAGDAAYRTFGVGGAPYRMVGTRGGKALVYVFDAEVEAYYSLERAKTDPLFDFTALPSGT